jgi:hypothetical protein
MLLKVYSAVDTHYVELPRISLFVRRRQYSPSTKSFPKVNKDYVEKEMISHFVMTPLQLITPICGL